MTCYDGFYIRIGTAKKWFVGITIVVILLGLAGLASSSQRFEEPACVPGTSIAVGALTAADHEQDEGWWSVGNYLVIKVVPDSLNNTKILPAMKGEEVIINIRLRKREVPQ